jgi:hypothetical protein
MADLAIQAQAQDINFIAKFESDLHNLLGILGKTNVMVVAPGTAYKTYKSSGSLDTSTVAENAEIPNSGFVMGDATVKELTYSKYRNLTSIEKIGTLGYDVAVGGSTDAMLRDIKKNIRASIITALSVDGATTGDAATFQAKIAKAAELLTVAFEDEVGTPVYFVNPTDAYDYLGTTGITVQNSFGISYIENFMGLGTIIIDSNVTEGTIYGTACENLDVVAVSVSAIPGMDLVTDETGIIGVHTDAAYSNGAIETVAYSGLSIEPVYEDRVVAVTTTV